MERAPKFSNLKDEMEYWKKLALDYKKGMDEAKEELDEYQVHSQELEHELEAQLEQAENQIKELKHANSRLQTENESVKSKYEACLKEYHNEREDLQGELDEYRSIKDELHRYIRELEQANDDLERAKRATVVSLEDFELRLNEAIERNVYLESELDEKEMLQVMVQRLKDEVRDLRQELQIRERDTEEKLDNDKKAENNYKSVDSNKLISDVNSVSSPLRKSGQPYVSMTPSTRASALHIVGDLLRKVGALESRLASCRRNVIRDTPSSTPMGKDQRSICYDIEEFDRCGRLNAQNCIVQLSNFK